MIDAGSSARLRAAIEVSPTMLAVTEMKDGRVLLVNDAFLRTMRYERGDVLGRTIGELGLWVDPAQRQRGLDVLRAGGSVRDLEARFLTKTGDEIVTIANADVIEVDGRRCVMTALMDITARVRAEAALRESERRFAQFFHANPLPMSIVRLRDGEHLDVNDAAVRHSGYAREEMLGRTKTALGMWVDPDGRARMQERLRRDGQVRDLEVAFRTKTGEVRQLLVNAEVITYGGEPAVLSVSVDITERAQMARAKDEFLAMLGHELRNPLGTITTTLGVLEQRVGDAEVRQLTAIIARQAMHLTRLVDDLLDVARVTSGKIGMQPRVVDLHQLAAAAIDALAKAGRTAAHDVAIEGEAVHVHGDPARLEQIVGNLVDNALKYTPAGGRVRVTVRRDGSHAVLAVRDTGEGIAADMLVRVFDLFVQQPQALDRARGGLGLGLTLVKRLVELHGGSVAATSAGGGLGSEFTVRLPATSPAEEDASPVARRAHATRPTRRVLVVEDNADARESLEMFLTLRGHEVATAGDATEAMEKLAAFRPNVAVVDIGLPGTDGYALARRIRASGCADGVRLVALTGYGQTEDRKQALAAGFDLHLTKPIDPEHLERLLA